MPMLCSLRSRKQQTKTAHCLNCKKSWTHDTKGGCPACNRKCNSRRKCCHYAQYCRDSQKGQSGGTHRKEKKSKGVKNPGPLKPLAK